MNRKSPFTIVCLGDSITCEWEEPKYPTYWQELLDQKYGSGKIEVIPAGVNGETAQDGYYRLDRDVLTHQPDLVTIMFGHNDFRYQIAPHIFSRYLAKSINHLKRHSIKHLWLLSPNQVWGSKNQKLYQDHLTINPALAQEKDITYIDVWSNAFKGQDLEQIYTQHFDYEGLTGRDHLHPNEKGHRLMAKYLFQQFNQKQLL